MLAIAAVAIVESEMSRHAGQEKVSSQGHMHNYRKTDSGKGSRFATIAILNFALRVIKIVTLLFVDYLLFMVASHYGCLCDHIMPHILKGCNRNILTSC